MSRVFLMVLDSFGIGGAPDAAAFGDEGANTLGHIAACVDLRLPHLRALGLGEAAALAAGVRPRGFEPVPLSGRWGCAVERSRGKDTPSGHWEIAGVPVAFGWHHFPLSVPAIPEALTREIASAAGVEGFLGNKHASGTEIIEELGEEHLRTNRPIIYTSADSVIQIAAHEERFGLDRLYRLCEVARAITLPLKVGRVIARPFVGENARGFSRTHRRKDFAIPPPEPTLLDRLVAQGREVISIGKIGDIFAHRGTGEEIKTPDNMAGFEAMLEAMRRLSDGGLAFTNLVDFDTAYGHRRDPQGYAAALEELDARLPEAFASLRPGDLLVITADHGCDPTWRGSDHTRECVPILCREAAPRQGSLGRRESYADIGQSIARHLGIPPLAHGVAWH